MALHVRRGDYASNPETQRVHGFCSPDYYRRAIDTVAARVADPRVFVFSDDPEWAERHLVLDHPTTIVRNAAPNAELDDFRMLARCRHHIIANSSFSWWGAWLASHPTQVVVAPAPWFAVDTYDTRDLLPAGWLRLPRDASAVETYR